jgi:capsid protein
MERLSEDSQAFAIHMQKYLKEWAVKAAAAPYLTGTLLQQIMEFDPKLTDLKTYLVSEKIASITKASSGSVVGTGAQFDLKLRYGIVTRLCKIYK